MEAFTNTTNAELLRNRSSQPKSNSLTARFANYGLQNSQQQFRSFSLQPAKITSSDFKAGNRARGIPTEAIVAQLKNEKLLFDRPVYRSLPRQAISPGPLARPMFARAATDPMGSVSMARKPFNALLRPPIYRGMSMTNTQSLLHHRASPPLFHGTAMFDRMAKGKFDPPPLGSAPAVSQIEIVIPQVPSPPYQLERHSSLFTVFGKLELKKAIEETLTKHGADFEFKPHKCKWKVFAYDKHQWACISIGVKVFQMASSPTSKPMYAVEFQRRQGDAFAFFRWFRPVYNSLVGKAFVVSKEGSHQRETTKQPFGADRLLAVPALQKEEFAPLLDMAQAQYGDVRAEAIRELAKLSENKENHSPIANGGFVPVVVSMLKSQNSDINRCAATLLANVAETEACAELLAGNGVHDALCEFMRKPDQSLAERQAQRESARALGNFLKAKVSQGKDSIRKLLHACAGSCNDPRLESECRKALA